MNGSRAARSGRDLLFGLCSVAALACSRGQEQVPAPTPAGGEDARLELRIEHRDSPSPRGTWHAELLNHGPDAVTIVLPGDGSHRGARTPVVEWIVEHADGSPAEVRGTAHCGNINPLTDGEIVSLRSGGSAAFDRYGFLPPKLPATGTFHVRLRYTNDPQREWTGIPLGAHAAGAMARVRASTPCTLVSNVVEITID